MDLKSTPRYPEVHIELHTRHPLAWISAVRQGLRLSGVAGHEIHRFTEEAFEASPRKVEEVCTSWARVERVEPEKSAQKRSPSESEA